jgi:hypothetical protein
VLLIERKASVMAEAVESQTLDQLTRDARLALEQILLSVVTYDQPRRN